MDELPFWVTHTEDKTSGTKAIFRPDAEAILKRVPVNQLRENLDKVVASLAGAFSSLKQVGSFRLKELEIQAEITAEGGVNLIGTATLAGKGAITLKFVE